MNLLIAEDDPISRLMLVNTLTTLGYQVTSAGDGEEAWTLCQENRFEIIISDWMMPQMDGLELCRRLRARPNAAYIYFILLTGKGERSERLEALQIGADDFLNKPLDREELTARLEVARRILTMQAELQQRTTELERLQSHLESLVEQRTCQLAEANESLRAQIEERKLAEQAVRELNARLTRSHEELAQAYDATIEGWSRALELRDRETEGHTKRVTEMTLRLAKALNLPEAERVHIRRGALLHDIGKMGIPDGILLKPDKLTPVEWEFMQRHTEYAYEMLAPIPFLRPALDIPYCHHEKWDGTGYPRGLKGEEIPLAARLFAMVDVWDALCSDRPYREGWAPER
ncbi:MAG TPA: HD domain-containing phosphohydrolase, partial [Chthonomonadaceae bacterium]|nr:HD domain-containing phosphohydrolase [Chthonomonadaceae bacterium]